MLWWLVPLCALWLLLALHDLRAVRRLRDLPPLPDAAAIPAVTVVVAVRDGASEIAGCIRGLLAQQQVDLRVVAVDDRSSDGTGAVLAGLAAADPRLRVVTVRELPPDWLGKGHALQVGAADADTPWLLFTDADAQLGPRTLVRAIAAAEATGADHVSLLPTHRRTTFLGRACLLAFQLVIQRRVAAVNRDHPRLFVGTGAFNLVRTDAYRCVGGHLPLRLEVVDDVWLGCLLRRAGYRSRVWLAQRDFAIDWGGTPKALVAVVAKNMFAVLRYRTPVALALVAGSALLLALTFAAPWIAGPAGWLALGSCLASSLPGALLARRMDWEVAAGVLVPFTRLLLPLALLNSTLRTLRLGGVRWRGTFYPLAQLRRGRVR